MLSFENDYLLGCTPEILRALEETNLRQLPGYTADPYCDAAREKIRAACACPGAGVEFLAGGTQVNALALDALLQPWQGVVCADTGHIALHEAGAVEFTGRKVTTLPQTLGRLDAHALAGYLETFFSDPVREHMVWPGAVYISHPTEYGTLYSLAELEIIAGLCRRYGLALYLDGARLAYALASPDTNVTLPDLARLCDAFTIGGAKCGALLGEALVFPRREPDHFVHLMKKHGALTAKGRVLGVQFDTLFTDGLYLRLGRQGDAGARAMCRAVKEAGLPFFLETPTNQQFLLLTNAQWETLQSRIALCFWERPDPDHVAVRFAASWATTDADVAAFRAALSDLMR